MFEEAIFFAAGAIFSWLFSRRDSQRRAASEEKTRGQIEALRSAVEDTLARLAPDSPELETGQAGFEPGGLLAAAGPAGADLQSALMRLKHHLEETDE